jgi:DNA/RNA-binding domain of Phe-tRNA-synthetase-like protein
MFIVSETWKTAYPGAAVGVLAMHNVVNPERHPALEARKEELENQLRARFSGCDRAALKALPIIEAYDDYCKRYKKTYHVQLQLESVVLKGKSIPQVAALVEAMFMAELKNLLLTAGHDLEAVQTPVRLDVAEGTERYIRLNGQEQQLKPGDMMIADAQGVISSVIYGPDRRTQITAGTRQVLFTVYAPPGIGEQAVYDHLRDIQANVLLIAPQAHVELLEVYGTELSEKKRLAVIAGRIDAVVEREARRLAS